MKRNPNQPKTHTNPAQNPASSPARPALSSGPKPKPKIQPSPKTPARSNHCAAQHTSSPRRPAWPSHAARSLSPLLPLTSWLSQATPRAPISLGPPASAPARPRVRVRPLHSGPRLSAPFPAAHASPSHCSAGPTCHLPPPALPQRPTEISGRNHRDLPSRAGPRDLRRCPFKPPRDPPASYLAPQPPRKP